MSSHQYPPDVWNEMKMENAERIESAIEHLEERYNFGFFSELGRASVPTFEIDFHVLWAETKEVQVLFNTLKPMDRNGREELWNRFNRFRDAARESQSMQRSRRDAALDENKGQIERALTNLEWSHDLRWLDDIIGGRKNLRDFWADAREIGTMFKELKPLRRDDREHLWDWFQRLCDKARYFQEQIDEDRERRQSEWRDRMHDKLDRLRELINKNEDVIERLDQQIAHCEDLRDNARTGDFADEVGGWIDEKERKKEDILQTNQELWDKIAEIERKLEQ